jgi:hypothetical protein
VDLDRIPPSRLAAYPLIITRRDPVASRPPSAYTLLWEGTYYQVWGRRPAAPDAIAHIGFAGGRALPCASVRRVATAALAWTHAQHAGGQPRGAKLIAAGSPELVRVSLAHSQHTARWTTGRVGLLMTGTGRLRTRFELPHSGVWDLWLEGELMPAVRADVDGRELGSIAGQVGGTSLTQQVMSPLRVWLSAGPHSLSITRAGAGLGPGEGGWADLRAIFLTPAGRRAQAPLYEASLEQWPSLCERSLQWVEAVPLSSSRQARA